MLSSIFDSTHSHALMPSATLTVTITGRWIVVALIAAAIGGLAAGLYPAWQAIRVDVAESLGNIE